MSIQDEEYTDEETTSPAGEEQAEATPAPVTEADMISRGKGMNLDAIAEDSPAWAALQAFKETVADYDAKEDAFKAVKAERNAQILALKDEHNVGFSAIAEVVGNTSSLVLYMYQRAQGMSAKEIREASQRSRQAKEQFRETDPNRKPVRKQSEGEKALRAAQKAALEAFLEEERAKAAAEAGELPGE